MVRPPNRKSGQTVVHAPSRLQPVAPALVGTLGGKSGQALPGARRLQPDRLGALAFQAVVLPGCI